jgi:hypothetical protein
MDYSDEPYVRKYTRKTATNRMLGWEGRAVLDEMLGEFDPAGVFDFRGDLVRAISAVTEIPEDVVRVGLERLIETETWIVRSRQVVWPTYEEAQNCKRSERLRQRESRKARAVKAANDVTPAAPVVTNVTGGHSKSQLVTLPPSAPSLCSLPSTHPEGEEISSSPPPPPVDPPTPPPTPIAGSLPAVREVFGEWQTVHGHPTAKLDAARTARIRGALKLFAPDQLKQAIRGALKDDWLMGRDAKSPRKYDGLETILRDTAKIEALIDLETGKTKPPRRVTNGSLQPDAGMTGMEHFKGIII